MHLLVGHASARQRVAQAMDADRLPQVILLVGPAGVGKQRFALWIAQRVLCERPDRGGEPCGGCRPCHLVLGLAHPDLHWLVPIPLPKAAEPDKQVEEASETIGEVLAERRARPLYLPPDGMAAHGLASTRLLQRRAALTPVEGRRKLFIIGDAERLVPQESSQQAANSVLKLLEEPPADSLFILTAQDRHGLLPTILSRAVPLRLHRLADAEVRSFLQSHLQPAPAPAELEARVEAARGCIGRALAAGDDEAKARQAALGLLEAAATGAAARYERALRQGTWQARGEFSSMLGALGELLSEAARAVTSGSPPAQLPAAVRGRVTAEGLARALALVAGAREAAQGNTNPQLLLATLAGDLAEVL